MGDSETGMKCCHYMEIPFTYFPSNIGWVLNPLPWIDKVRACEGEIAGEV